MDDINLATFTDDEITLLDQALMAEKERRQNLVNIPTQMAILRQKFIDGGGDPADLNVDSLTEQE